MQYIIYVRNIVIFINMKGDKDMSKNLSLTMSEAVIRYIAEIACFLGENCEIQDFRVRGNRTTTTYKVDDRYITVRRDANTHAYSVDVRLKENGTLTGRTKEGVIASSDPDGCVPF